MPVIELTPDDPRVGQRTPEGRRFPVVDMAGQPCDPRQGGLTTRSLGNGYFVVIPPGQDDKLQVTLVLPAPEVMPAEPVMEAAEPKKRVKSNDSD